ncbi:hypothetical protein QBC43DRAFT_272130 [Cladorrhinum sp. PSN259]|nr:hypothetical protein QBC43DRAFT_272130 [Cladorrhinum sp. PSN259]
MSPAYIPDGGPPYPSPTLPIGLTPTPIPDIPLCATFILLYLVYIPLNLVLSPHDLYSRPIFTVILTVFPVLRIVSLALRIVWSLDRSNLKLEISATVFSFAGVVLLYILDLLSARRYVRDYAVFGYRPIVKGVFRFGIALIIISLIMGIIVTANVYFVPRDNNREEVLKECRDVALVAGTILAVLAFVPVLVVAVVICFKAGDVVGIEKRRYRARTELLLSTAALLSLEAGFRVGSAYAARPVGEKPGWYESKAAFYCLTYLLELLVIYSLLAARLDGRFRKRRVETGPGRGWSERVNTQEEVFGDPG